jgi:hypothetical protein
LRTDFDPRRENSERVNPAGASAPAYQKQREERKMTRKEYAKSKGITVDRLRDEEMSFLQCEGYDDDGNEYDTSRWTLLTYRATNNKGE